MRFVVCCLPFFFFGELSRYSSASLYFSLLYVLRACSQCHHFVLSMFWAKSTTGQKKEKRRRKRRKNVEMVCFRLLFVGGRRRRCWRCSHNRSSRETNVCRHMYGNGNHHDVKSRNRTFAHSHTQSHRKKRKSKREQEEDEDVDKTRHQRFPSHPQSHIQSSILYRFERSSGDRENLRAVDFRFVFALHTSGSVNTFSNKKKRQKWTE